ncbi:MAG: Rpn family recombination-promoting nuclease/putative transposase [Crocosphaera sp.]
MVNSSVNGDRYINLLTDFGFKRLFGSEPHKVLLIDFLNSILPSYHTVADISYKSNENVGNTALDRKAIFDLYCESEAGEKFIVEIQKAKQNYFKDRSVYYATFPIQEQAIQGEWNYKLSSVYTIGILDFIFDDNKNDPNFFHTVELKDQNCQVFYERLKFIYIELPKFQKTLENLENHFDKWLFLFRHLSELDIPPEKLQEGVFNQLFEIAEIAKFSPDEQRAYQNSLKYYRDLNNVVETSRQEGRQEGMEEGRREGIQEGEAKLVLRQLQRRLGDIPENIQETIRGLSVEQLEELGIALLDFKSQSDLITWLAK